MKIGDRVKYSNACDIRGTVISFSEKDDGSVDLNYIRVQEDGGSVYEWPVETAILDELQDLKDLIGEIEDGI